jgi:HK97 family phage portal protein
MSWLAQIGAALGFAKSTPEGAYHPGPYFLERGWLPHEWGQFWNFWQMDRDPLPYGLSAMVEACVSAYAQTIAMCPFGHWRSLDNGGRELVTTSALSRIIRAPNDYQTRSDFLLNLVRSLYLDGNAYALGLRNDRFEISSLHLMHPRQCSAATAEGEIFYSLGGNPVIENRVQVLGFNNALAAVPARDVLHVKLQTPTDPLHGESPLSAAQMAIAATNAAMAQSIRFFGNQSRPSGVLQTDLTLTKTQVEDLRDRWNEHSKGLGSGGTPILTSGLKFNPVNVSARDAQFAEAMKLSDAQVAEVFRIPLAIIGSEAQPVGSTEALMNLWISTGLGFALNQVELAFDRLFGLDRFDGQYSELDSSVLLRSAFRDKIEGLARAVQGGIYAPNEARALVELARAEDGDEPRVQQQVVPLSFNAKPPEPAAPALPPPPGPPEDDADKMTVSDWNRYFEGATP